LTSAVVYNPACITRVCQMHVLGGWLATSTPGGQCNSRHTQHRSLPNSSSRGGASHAAQVHAAQVHAADTKQPCVQARSQQHTSRYKAGKTQQQLLQHQEQYQLRPLAAHSLCRAMCCCYTCILNMISGTKDASVACLQAHDPALSKASSTRTTNTEHHTQKQ
jgi:hypothetical protein